jgi:hypothetical protein
MPSFEDTVKQTIKEILRNVFEDDDVVESLFPYFAAVQPSGLNDPAPISPDPLPKILGSGAIILEDLILEALYAKYNLDLVWKKDHRFVDYLQELRTQTTRELAPHEVESPHRR